MKSMISEMRPEVVQGLRTNSAYILYDLDLNKKNWHQIAMNLVLNPSSREDAQSMERVFLEMNDLLLFLRLTAHSLGSKDVQQDLFTEKTARAHWQGSSFSMPIDKGIFVRIVDDIFPGEKANEKRQYFSERFEPAIGLPPNHNLCVFCDLISMIQRYGGKISDTTFNYFNNCLVKAVKVLEIENETILVETLTLSQKEGSSGLVLKPTEERIEKGFLKEIQPGNYVFSHLRRGRKKATSEGAETLNKMTQKTFELILKRA